MRFYIYIALAIALAGAGFHYRHTIAQNAQLKAAVNSANSIIEGLGEWASGLQDKNTEKEEAIDEIESAPEKDDGAIAPILRRTLERL